MSVNLTGFISNDEDAAHKYFEGIGRALAGLWFWKCVNHAAHIVFRRLINSGSDGPSVED